MDIAGTPAVAEQAQVVRVVAGRAVVVLVAAGQRVAEDVRVADAMGTAAAGPEGAIVEDRSATT